MDAVTKKQEGPTETTLRTLNWQAVKDVQSVLSNRTNVSEDLGFEIAFAYAWAGGSYEDLRSGGHLGSGKAVIDGIRKKVSSVKTEERKGSKDWTLDVKRETALNTIFDMKAILVERDIEVVLGKETLEAIDAIDAKTSTSDLESMASNLIDLGYKTGDIWQQDLAL